MHSLNLKSFLNLPYYIIPFVLLLLSACNNERQPEPDGTLPGEQSLTVLALDVYASVLRRAGNAMSTAWAEEGRSFNLEVTAYHPSERDIIRTRLQTQLLAGEGPDLFFWDGHPLWMQATPDLFADFFQLMDQDPHTSREDFYTHILDAWALDGGLYIFPLSFDFSYVGISSFLPQSIIDRFTQKTTISPMELYEIHLDLRLNYGEDFGHFLFWSHPNMAQGMAGFIDFNDRTSHLNDGSFAQFLEYWRQTNEMPPEISTWEGSQATDMVRQHKEWEANHNAFSFSSYFDRSLHSAADAFFVPEAPPFIHFIPLAAPDGRLIIQQSNIINLFEWTDWEEEAREDWNYWIFPSWGSVSVNAASDGGLAWEFTQHLITAVVRNDVLDHIRDSHPPHSYYYFGRRTFTTPIKRAYTETQVMAAWEQLFREDIQSARFFGISQQGFEHRRPDFEVTLARLEVFNNMPVVLAPHIPGDLYEDVLQEFMLGFSSAQQVAEEIHNRMTLWLIE